jgi:phytol kinase
MSVSLPPLMHPASPLIECGRAMGVAAAFLLLLLVAEFWQRRGAPPVEWTRKLVHIGGGLLAAGLPWMIASPWSAVGLCLLFVTVVRGARPLGLLRSIHGIERRSAGDLSFILGALLLFLMGRGQPLYYLTSILVLTLADSLAALYGSAHGRRGYVVGSERRSLEGSAVFLLIGFSIIGLSLLLMTDQERGAAVLLSAHLALLLTCLEAVSPRGSDNLLLPLAGYFLLGQMSLHPAIRIGELLLLQGISLGTLALIACRSSLLTVGEALAIHVILCGALTLGGAQWLVPAALGVVGSLAAHRFSQRRQRAAGRLPLQRSRAPLATYHGAGDGGRR